MGEGYTILKTYKNGVRTGNVTRHKTKSKREGGKQAWFPKNWDRDKIKAAGGVKGKHFGNHDGVRVGIFIDENGKITTIFPDGGNQPGG